MIRARFTSMGASEDLAVQETILIRDGYYCGRRLQCGDFEAIWFVEENQVKFYDADHSLAIVCAANAAEQSHQSPTEQLPLDQEDRKAA